MTETADNIVARIHDRAGAAKVRFGLILGSGLGHLADTVSMRLHRLCRSAGLSGGRGFGPLAPKLVDRTILKACTRVAVLRAGASHYYENGRVRRHAPAARSAGQAWGRKALIATNAAGSLRDGHAHRVSLMMLNDHINFSGLNPLIGEPTDAAVRVRWSTRYDPDVCAPP